LTEKFYNLEINSDPNNLLTVEEFVNYFAHDLLISEEKIPGLMLAVTEATTNAIIHANKGDANKIVTINVEEESDKIIITVKDEGEGFDPSSVPDPTEPENLLKDSGRGLYLMKIYMDRLDFKVTPEGCETILVMKK
jgi:serine/threonine-protein kinase RsbW